MYKKMQTKNGLSVLASPMKHMTSVSLSVWIGVGGRYESKEQSGISHLIEHMLFKGTYSRTAKELKENVEGVGGAFNGFTSDEVTCYMVKVPSEYMELGLDVLADMVQNAKISEEDLYISSVIHKSYVDVNENGTEAAAVTSITFTTTSAGNEPPKVYFNVNKPFVFAITEKDTDAILFIGEVNHPEYE